MIDNAQINCFGSRLQKRLKMLKLQQSDLAEQVEISTNHMSTLETGKSHPCYELLCKLCNALDVTPDYLMLGNMHSSNITKNIVDKLRLCNDKDLQIIDQIIEVFITNSNEQ